MAYRIGIDEAGRGPWLGPVVACALAFHPKNLPSKKFLLQLNDSKKLSEKKRKELFSQLIEMSVGKKPNIFFGIGVVDNFVIDEINIKQANKEAMRRSLLECLRKIPPPNPLPSKEGRMVFVEKCIEVYIDGNDNYRFDELKKQPEFIVGGDGKVLEISAASIIAKVFRDDLISVYAKLYPDLGLEGHKGYGTQKHREYLQGSSCITGIHRLSYKPLKAILERGNGG